MGKIPQNVKTNFDNMVQENLHILRSEPRDPRYEDVNPHSNDPEGDLVPLKLRAQEEFQAQQEQQQQQAEESRVGRVWAAPSPVLPAVFNRVVPTDQQYQPRRMPFPFLSPFAANSIQTNSSMVSQASANGPRQLRNNTIQRTQELPRPQEPTQQQPSTPLPNNIWVHFYEIVSLVSRIDHDMANKLTMLQPTLKNIWEQQN
jgi:hypothetical protein